MKVSKEHPIGSHELQKEDGRRPVEAPSASAVTISDGGSPVESLQRQREEMVNTSARVNRQREFQGLVNSSAYAQSLRDQMSSLNITSSHQIVQRAKIPKAYEEAGRKLKHLFKSRYLEKGSGRLLSKEELNMIAQSSQSPNQIELLNSYVKSGTKQDAIDYINKKNYKDWLQLHPAKRLLITSLVHHRDEGITLSDEELKKTPPYAMALSLSGDIEGVREHTADMWEQTLDTSFDPFTRDEQTETVMSQYLRHSYEEEHPAPEKRRLESSTHFSNRKAEHEANVDEYIGETKQDPERYATEAGQLVQEHENGIEILKRIFLLLQAGLKEHTEGGDYTKWEEKVSTALSHGGRVNIKIPKLTKGMKSTELTDWLGITKGTQPSRRPHLNVHKDAHSEPTKPRLAPETGLFERKFGSHRLDVSSGGEMKEAGGKRTGAASFLDKTYRMGLNLTVGGVGQTDFNGDYILPDGKNGHMYIGFFPPTDEKFGSLQIGIETTAPGADSNVGYIHNFKSTEATANPLSSSGGAKADKHGIGKLMWNEIDLSDLDVPIVEDISNWLDQLKALEDRYDELKEQGLMSSGELVGKRSDFRALIEESHDKF